MTLKTDLLETSFAMMCDREADFTSNFYNNLFIDYPEVKPLFAHVQMSEQSKKLFASLVLVVNNLTKPDILTNTLHGLGTRHLKYGVLPEHYPKVGGTFLKTMAFVLKDKWTEEYAAAWAETYTAITEIMLDGCNYPPEVLSPKT